MKADVNNVYILSPAELTVIAAAKNIQGIFSIQNTDVTVDETVVCQALNQLYQKQFIHNLDGEGFVLDDGLRELISVIETAKKLVLVRRFTKDASIKSIYIGADLVAVEQRLRDMGAVRLYKIPRDGVEDFLQECLQKDESTLRKVLDEDRLVQEGIQKKHVLQDEEVEGMGNIVTMVERVIPQKQYVTDRIIAKQEKKWMQFRQDKKRIEFLKEPEFFDNIIRLIEEDLDDIS